MELDGTIQFGYLVHQLIINKVMQLLERCIWNRYMTSPIV